VCMVILGISVQATAVMNRDTALIKSATRQQKIVKMKKAKKTHHWESVGQVIMKEFGSWIQDDRSGAPKIWFMIVRPQVYGWIVGMYHLLYVIQDVPMK